MKGTYKRCEFTYESIDFLTNLHNRRYFLDYVDMLIKEDIEFSMFIIDLNRFKLVNDVYGHDVGDVVLSEVGERFNSLESEKILFARLGGDEFSAIYKTNDEEEINAFGEKVNKVLEDNILVNESEFAISASIGVSRFPTDSRKKTELLKLADIAMYQSKKSENDDTYLISDELTNKLRERKKIEELLKDIDVEKELFLEYQPIFDFETGEVVATEALVRWNHKDEGIIQPLSFIPVAEEVDFVAVITKWTFINALNQIKQWNEKYKKDLKISINVSNLCIHNKIFFGNLKYMLDTFGIKPKWLQIQLKELSLAASPEYMKKLLQSLSDLGIEIQIDDFGTSPIMLSSLKDFKISTIKVDNKYIESLDNVDIFNFVDGLIAFAHKSGIEVLAEGVETKEQYECLELTDMDYYQGFYKERPISAEDFENKYLVD